MNKVNSWLSIIVVTALVGLAVSTPQTARASISTWAYTGGGTSGQDFAEAVFNTSGSSLTILLINSYSGTTTTQADTLTGVTFNVGGSITGGTHGTAVELIGTTEFTSQTAKTVLSANLPVNPGWGYGAYDGSGSLIAGGGSNAVEASGRLTNYSLLGANKGFDGSTPLDGSAYGLLSASTSAASSLATDLNKQPYFSDSVLITLYGSGLNGDVTNVGFQWGTGSEDAAYAGTEVPGGGFGGSVPEPTSVAVWGIVSGIAAGAVAMRKRRRAAMAGRWSDKNRAAIYEVVRGRTKT